MAANEIWLYLWKKYRFVVWDSQGWLMGAVPAVSCVQHILPDWNGAKGHGTTEHKFREHSPTTPC